MIWPPQIATKLCPGYSLAYEMIANPCPGCSLGMVYARQPNVNIGYGLAATMTAENHSALIYIAM